MPSCAVKRCKNNSKISKKCHGITFHMLPTSIIIRDEWVAAIRLSRNDTQWQPSSSSVVCSDHFDETDMYYTKRGLRRIHRTGYPKKKLFPPSNAVVSDLLSPKISPPFVPNLPVSPSVVIDSNCVVLPSTSSAAVLDLPDKPKADVDQESIFDTPRKHRSRQKLKKGDLKLKKCVPKIKSLQQKIRRLQNRNLSLKKIIKKLKNSKFD